ncbi:MAG: ubiquitin fusion degradation protein [Pleopsidium flavum]|nr:MAG: ubiquitin fusion degradation protein [Pleopsidium flavum]
MSSNFLVAGHKLNAKKGSKAPTPKASTPVAGVSTNSTPQTYVRKTNGPQPLRLPPGKLFFGYEIKPVRKTGEEKQVDETQPKFQGAGQTLRGGTKRKGDGVGSDAEGKAKAKEPEKKDATAGGQKLEGGRTLRDNSK